MSVEISLDHLTFAVKDLELSSNFAQNVLGATLLAEINRGDTTRRIFELGGRIFNFVSEKIEGKGYYADYLRKYGDRLHHLGFSVSDLNAFKDNMFTNGIKSSEWELEGDQAIRDEVIISTEYAPTMLQIIHWKDKPISTINDWLEREKAYINKHAEFKDMRQQKSKDTTSPSIGFKILGVDHISLAVSDLSRTESFIEKVLGGTRRPFEAKRGKSSVTHSFIIAGQLFSIASEDKVNGKGFYADFLRKYGDGLHHIGLSVDNLDAFKDNVIANGVNIPKRELEGDKAVRDEVVIGNRYGTEYAATTFQVLHWKGSQPENSEERLTLGKRYYKQA